MAFNLRKGPTKKQLLPDYTYPNAIRLVHSGSDYFNQMKLMIRDAKQIIHLHVYIFESDETGIGIAEELINAASRGVKVYLLVDGYASQSLSKEFISKIKDAGINFNFFDPILKSKNFYFGRRLHQKVFVVDDYCSMVGGINITNRYNDMPDKQAWLDFALYCEGPISMKLSNNCWQTWNGFLKNIKPYHGFEIVENLRTDFKDVQIRMCVNDWVRGKVQISKSYVRILTYSNEKVILLSSYFLPGSIIRKSIKKAIKRGVVIKIIMTGKSDVGISKRAERYMYDWLLRNKIQIYEYQKEVLHGKISVGDKKFVTVGSYNVNDISALASMELNLDVSNDKFGNHVDEVLEKIISSDCINVTEAIVLKHKSMFHQFRLWLAYFSVRVLILLFTFYFRKTESTQKEK